MYVIPCTVNASVNLHKVGAHDMVSAEAMLRICHALNGILGTTSELYIPVGTLSTFVHAYTHVHIVHVLVAS